MFGVTFPEVNSERNHYNQGRKKIKMPQIGLPMALPLVGGWKPGGSGWR
jgi:hypothetical protein